jgi:hypothetical protein
LAQASYYPSGLGHGDGGGDLILTERTMGCAAADNENATDIATVRLLPLSSQPTPPATPSVSPANEGDANQRSNRCPLPLLCVGGETMPPQNHHPPCNMPTSLLPLLASPALFLGVVSDPTSGCGENAPRGGGANVPRGGGANGPRGGGENAPRASGANVPRGGGENAPRGSYTNAPTRSKKAPKVVTDNDHKTWSSEDPRRLVENMSDETNLYVHELFSHRYCKSSSFFAREFSNRYDEA